MYGIITKPPQEPIEFIKLLFEFEDASYGSPSEDARKEMDKSLGLIAKYCGSNRVILAELSEEGKNARVIHSYLAPVEWLNNPPPLAIGSPPTPQRNLNGKERLPDEFFPTDKEESLVNKATTSTDMVQGLTLPVGPNGSSKFVLFLDSPRRGFFSTKLIAQLQHLNKALSTVLKQEKAMSPLQALNQFERLLSKISKTYINIPLPNLEKDLSKDFKGLNEAIGADVSILYMVKEDAEGATVGIPLIWHMDEDLPSNGPLLEWLKSKPTIDNKHYPFLFSQWKKGVWVSWGGHDEIPPEAEPERQDQEMRGVKSALGIPILFAGSMRGILNIATTQSYRSWPKASIPRLRILGEIFINALMRKKSEERLQNALSEIRQLKERFEADYLYLKEEVDLGHDFADVAGQSDPIRKTLAKAKQVAASHVTVLLLGETGTGKGLIARAIHNASHRKDRPFVQVNCAALSPHLIESELFGHEKGAFTGATGRRIGRFEAAKGTTLFLDEIGELPLELQPKLLRLIEEGEFERVGGNTTIRTDVRIIAATNANLSQEVEAGRFRRDLWYRLNIFPIIIPPLRDRLDDIPSLVGHFLKKFGKRSGEDVEAIPMQIIKALQAYSWPGNVRELKNVIERMALNCDEKKFHFETPQMDLLKPCKGLTLKEATEKTEREMVLRALEESGWVIEGPHGAAEQLGVSGSNLRYYVRKFDIKRPHRLSN
jgi:formate hydrogenlyase transcriptional activator